MHIVLAPIINSVAFHYFYRITIDVSTKTNQRWVLSHRLSWPECVDYLTMSSPRCTGASKCEIQLPTEQKSLTTDTS